MAIIYAKPEVDMDGEAIRELSEKVKCREFFSNLNKNEKITKQMLSNLLKSVYLNEPKITAVICKQLLELDSVVERDEDEMWYTLQSSEVLKMLDKKMEEVDDKKYSMTRLSEGIDDLEIPEKLDRECINKVLSGPMYEDELKYLLAIAKNYQVNSSEDAECIQDIMNFISTNFKK